MIGIALYPEILAILISYIAVLVIIALYPKKRKTSQAPKAPS
jgi:hypothetical protein